MKLVLKSILGLTAINIGFIIIILTWLTFYTDQEFMLIYASFLISLFIGIIIASIGIFLFIQATKLMKGEK